MRRAYKILLRLYPRDFKASFATEMILAFERTAEERRTLGRTAFLRFGLAELSGLLIGAVNEWFAKLRTDPSIRGRRLPDRLLMRPPGVSWNDYYGLYQEREARENLRQLRAKYNLSEPT